MKRSWILASLVVVLALIATACGGGSDDASDTAPSSGSAASESYPFGEPGDDASVDRVVEVAQSDAMEFDPASIDVRSGETVRFEVTNEGENPHEFVLGDQALQAEHEEEMGSMGGMMTSDEPYAIAVDPGQTESVVWTFSVPGTFEYGCHAPGHYAAGMRGEISVT